MNLITGGIYITSALRRSSGGMTHHLVVTARDGQGVEAERPAHVHVHVSVIGAMSSNQQRTPVFDAPRYVFPVREDVTPHSVVGNVIARAADQGSHGVRYAIRSGNDQGLFTIDPIRGLISVEKTLDFETAASVLLNVQAAAGNPPAYGHAQVSGTMVSMRLKVTRPIIRDQNEHYCIIHILWLHLIF